MGDTGPDPKDARTPAEFVAAMRRLRSWADLSYRQLERRAEDAGDVLPRATTSAALARTDLPREELLIAFVRACGGSAATVEAWVDARRRLAMREPAGAGDSGAADGPRPNSTYAATASNDLTASHTAAALGAKTAPDTDRTGRRRTLRMTAAGAGIAAALLALIAAWPSGKTDDKPTAAPPSPGNSGSRPPAGAAPQPGSTPRADSASATPASTGMPESGWVRMHPANSSSLCITEGRERNGRTHREIAVQRPCTEALQPRVYLESLGDQTYRIQWHHPRIGKGCLGVDEALVEGAQLMSPGDCTDAPGLKYRLEPSAGGYRLRPLDSDQCIGILPPRTGGAEAIQAECTGTEDQAFRFSPAATP
ncbi:hypothetical protein C0216_32685 (plasmid) [Streptomyces globosus]|uniref:XRE family transcriptional regulator n=1 Tax=Streptomyces globosus TaxID=68209 RepID=A0A344UBG7_9ACTN|nr:RICIN domain-containing protein [Streptomyces globosus]AXE28238.1 hypothetical protein C0216_32685 [Streptomyces globosus]